MDLLQSAINDLSTMPAAVSAMVMGLDEDTWRWRPDDGTWSLLEIVHHLADEEREDFPLRVRLLLEDPAEPWPPIDPEGWVVSREYNRADPAKVLHEFVQLRKASLGWLQNLEDPAWDNSFDHPLAGVLTARRLVHCWRAHDLLHLRQLLHRRWQFLSRGLPVDELDYAGRW